jgi:hypothetical protein
MILRQGVLAEGEARLVGLIDGAAEEIAALLDELCLAARIAEGRYAPLLREVDTLELARSADARITVSGRGAVVSTEPEAVSNALAGLAVAALRHGSLATVSWTVAGRTLDLSPLNESARAAVDGSSTRDLRALVARLLLEALGGRLEQQGETLRIELA